MRQPEERLYGTAAMTPVTRQRRSPLGLFPDKPAPRLYDCIVEVLRVRHYSRGTEEAYGPGVTWPQRRENDDDLHPCPEPGSSRCPEPCARSRASTRGTIGRNFLTTSYAVIHLMDAAKRRIACVAEVSGDNLTDC